MFSLARVRLRPTQNGGEQAQNRALGSKNWSSSSENAG